MCAPVCARTGATALVIASALSVPDPRERPLERAQAADQAHLAFRDARSDFLSLIALWEFFDSPAQKAGIETGDVIVTFNGVAVEQSSDLPPIVGTTAVGDRIPVEVIRGGEQRRLTIEIGALPDEEPALAGGGEGDAAKPRVDAKLGLAVAALSKEQRAQLQVESGGVLVENIEDGAAYAAGLRIDDVILQLNNQAIDSVDKFKQVEADLLRLDAILKTVVSAPRDPAPRREAGMICLRNGQPAEALRWLHGALEVAPNDKETHAILADVYTDQGDFTQANYHRQRAR